MQFFQVLSEGPLRGQMAKKPDSARAHMAKTGRINQNVVHLGRPQKGPIPGPEINPVFWRA